MNLQKSCLRRILYPNVYIVTSKVQIAQSFLSLHSPPTLSPAACAFVYFHLQHPCSPSPHLPCLPAAVSYSLPIHTSDDLISHPHRPATAGVPPHTPQKAYLRIHHSVPSPPSNPEPEQSNRFVIRPVANQLGKRGYARQHGSRLTTNK